MPPSRDRSRRLSPPPRRRAPRPQAGQHPDGGRQRPDATPPRGLFDLANSQAGRNHPQGRRVDRVHGPRSFPEAPRRRLPGRRLGLGRHRDPRALLPAALPGRFQVGDHRQRPRAPDLPLTVGHLLPRRPRPLRNAHARRRPQHPHHRPGRLRKPPLGPRGHRSPRPQARPLRSRLAPRGLRVLRIVPTSSSSSVVSSFVSSVVLLSSSVPIFLLLLRDGDVVGPSVSRRRRRAQQD
mmetsp:Transcript_1685/g.5034  ORF Transcript_1685/g.5034 Transcript_1685/m.5034 type:complete len:237 (-) Transcript_1685:242-952(-)